MAKLTLVADAGGGTAVEGAAVAGGAAGAVGVDEAAASPEPPSVPPQAEATRPTAIRLGTTINQDRLLSGGLAGG